MSETVIVALVGAIASVTSFFLGKRWEQHHQTMLVRAQMLGPIEEWLTGAERLVGILGDTLTSVSLQSPGPMMYDLEERRTTARVTAERINSVLGILESKTLVTRETRRVAERLLEKTRTLDQEIKFVLLPLDTEIVERSNQGNIDTDLVVKVGQTKLLFDQQLQEAHSLIAQLKTKLT